MAPRTKKPLDDSPENAFQRLVRLCNQQERSSSEVKQRLLRIGFSEDNATAAVERAVRCGLVDDARYADILVRSRVSQGRGLSGIATELKKQGIDPDEVQAYADALEEIDDEQELQRAIEFLNRHPSHSKNLVASAYRKLVTKGYRSSIALEAAKRWAG